MIIGSHVGCSGKDMLVGSVKEAISYGANTFMFYTGAPQNTRRKSIEEFNITEAKKLMEEHAIDFDNVVVHAPYIINLANTTKPETFELAVSFLKEEINRCELLGAKHLVLHPGSHVGAGLEAGIDRIIEGLNMVITEEQNVKIALETMSGKGTEVGFKFDQIAQIIDGVTFSSKLEVCMDTCHVSDAGYDIVNNLDAVLIEFDKLIGLDKLAVMHINDSKNIPGAKKDRHENFGFGHLGFDTLINIIYHPKLAGIPMLLETPYIVDENTNKRTYPPYKQEIEMIRNKKFDENLIERIVSSYEK